MPGNLKGPRRKVAALCVLVIVAGIGVTIWTEVKQPPTSDQYVPAPRGTVTFSKDIAPILFDHCAACHRPGQSAPFALLTYQDVRKHAKEIADVTARRYMPPWLPEPGYGDFVGARLLSAGQIGMIRQWVNEGGIEGNVSDLPLLPKWSENWQLGEPDLVVNGTRAIPNPALAAFIRLQAPKRPPVTS
ncbi:MAG: hypothetical protein ABI651_11830 [Verrucomicrobiota bacterium]